MLSGLLDMPGDTLRAYCRKWKIRKLEVFGSALRDDFGPDSDLDVLVTFEDDEDWDLFDAMDMKDELAAIVGRDVDIVSRSVIESCDNRFIKREILSSAEPLLVQR
jgi:predicted nucleotidyltransferase